MGREPLAVAASLVLLAAAAVATPAAPARDAARCAHGRAPQPATLSIEGNLYAVVRGERERYAFGWSGVPVLGIPEAFTLIRRLGFKGTDAGLLRRLRRELPGVDFADGGGSSDFFFACRGTYRTTALVRSDRGSITGTRLWLRQGDPRVTRAFCMPEQWVPVGAHVSVTFRVPLGRTPPVFELDWDGDGKVDSIGPFQPGGAAFPRTERCG